MILIRGKIYIWAKNGERRKTDFDWFTRLLWPNVFPFKLTIGVGMSSLRFEFCVYILKETTFDEMNYDLCASNKGTILSLQNTQLDAKLKTFYNLC